MVRGDCLQCHDGPRGGHLQCHDGPGGEHLYSMTGHVLVSCRLTQENVGTSSALSLPIHSLRRPGQTACDPLRPSSTAL